MGDMSIGSNPVSVGSDSIPEEKKAVPDSGLSPTDLSIGKVAVEEMKNYIDTSSFSKKFAGKVLTKLWSNDSVFSGMCQSVANTLMARSELFRDTASDIRSSWLESKFDGVEKEMGGQVKADFLTLELNQVADEVDRGNISPDSFKKLAVKEFARAGAKEEKQAIVNVLVQKLGTEDLEMFEKLCLKTDMRQNRQTGSELFKSYLSASINNGPESNDINDQIDYVRFVNKALNKINDGKLDNSVITPDAQVKITETHVVIRTNLREQGQMNQQDLNTAKKTGEDTSNFEAVRSVIFDATQTLNENELLLYDIVAGTTTDFGPVVSKSEKSVKFADTASRVKYNVHQPLSEFDPKGVAKEEDTKVDRGLSMNDSTTRAQSGVSKKYTFEEVSKLSNPQASHLSKAVDVMSKEIVTNIMGFSYAKYHNPIEREFSDLLNNTLDAIESGKMTKEAALSEFNDKFIMALEDVLKTPEDLEGIDEDEQSGVEVRADQKEKFLSLTGNLIKDSKYLEALTHIINSTEVKPGRNTEMR